VLPFSRFLLFAPSRCAISGLFERRRPVVFFFFPLSSVAPRRTCCPKRSLHFFHSPLIPRIVAERSVPPLSFRTGPARTPPWAPFFCAPFAGRGCRYPGPVVPLILRRARFFCNSRWFFFRPVRPDDSACLSFRSGPP